MKIIERRGTYRTEARFGGYLFSVANSVLVDAHRKHLRVVDSALDRTADIEELTAGPATDPERASNLQRATRALMNAIGRLPMVQRNTFLLRQESGLSYAAIAEVTDTTTETVKSRLRYAKTRLAEDLKEELRHVEL